MTRKHLATGLALVLVLSAIVALRSSSPAFACSCLPIEGQLARPGLVGPAFVGTVVAAPDVSGQGMSTRLVTWTFLVEAVYRGELPPTIEVQSEASSASCGLSARVGSRLGVLLQRDGNSWHSGLCSTGTPEMFAVLGTPSAPRADTAAEPVPTNATIPVEGDSSPGTLLLVLAGVAVVGAAAVAVVVRRRQPV